MSSALRAQSATCFRARPLAECRGWVPFAIDLVVRVGSTSPSVDSPYGYAPGNELDFGQFGAFDIGYMRNRDSTHAIGGLLEVGTNGVDDRLALKMRRQQWLSRSLAASAGIGVVRAEQQIASANGTTYAYGVTGDIGLDVGDDRGVFLSGDLTQQAGRHPVAALRVGLRNDSYAAVAVTALLALLDVTILSPSAHRH
jgi:hypothetical protein